MSLSLEILDLAKRTLSDGRHYCIRASPNYMIYAYPDTKSRVSVDGRIASVIPNEAMVALKELQSLGMTLQIDIQTNRLTAYS